MSKSISLYEVKQGKKCNMETGAAHTSLQQPWWRWNTIQLKSMYIACNSPQPTSLSTQHQCQLKPSKRGPFWVWVLLSSDYFSSPSPLQCRQQRKEEVAAQWTIWRGLSLWCRPKSKTPANICSYESELHVAVTALHFKWCWYLWHAWNSH